MLAVAPRRLDKSSAAAFKEFDRVKPELRL